MAAQGRQGLAALLGELEAPGSFSARRVAPPNDLHIEVRGVGALCFPVPDEQARALCQIARPARYGRGELTLLDRRVRDTWEIPASRVRIDKRRWNKTLVPILDALRNDLGLPSGSRLEAELHAMLVYARGQFFLPHKDSEKHDEMIGTLVVTLPAPFTGGGLVVEHEGQRATYRGSKAALSFVAFYADCRHEVKPVTSGHRVVLTYNLLLRRNTSEPAPSDVPPEVAEELARLLQEHFAEPPPARWRGDRAAGEPPSRLVYLLDHEYTERGLDWGRLKGRDAGRALPLRDIAQRVECDAVLALAKVHETWSTIQSDYEDRWYGRRRSGGWNERDNEGVELDDHEVDELIEQSVELECWMEPSAAPRVRPVALSVPDYEVCATTPSDQLKPYASEYEGNMGNYGNTLDRWYRRGAVLLWPKAKAFAVRAEVDPAWALTSISTRLRAGEMAEAREMAASLAPFWAVATRAARTSRFVTAALRVAGGLDEPALARLMLAPLQTEALGRAHAAPLAALVERYGEGFLARLLETWSGRRQQWNDSGITWSEWVVSLPGLCDALCTRGSSGTAAALVLVQDSTHHLTTAITQALAVRAPSRRNQALEKLAEPLAAVLHSAALLGAVEIRDELIGFCQAGGDELLVCLVNALRAAAALAPELRRQTGFDVLADHCADRLASRLTRPQRKQGDWSIEPPRGCGCGCELCSVLSDFLRDPAAQVLEWPLAEQRRRHVHATIDAAELPVRHQTRRSGRPYTLVLTKTDALFESERQEQAREDADAAWLAAAWGSRSRAPGQRRR
ncbi:MAG: 2OG-Fe(II) oxygenase [Solirubrobacteraceae bacterium]